MTIFKIVLLLIVNATLYQPPLSAQGFINPGVKLGYTFGSQGGFTYGFEISYTTALERRTLGGVVVDVDFSPGLIILHIGMEATEIGPEANAIPWPGFCLGPSIVWQNNHQSEIAISATLYAGLLAYPYVEYTFRPFSSDLFQAGTYLKIPISTYNGTTIWDWRFD